MRPSDRFDPDAALARQHDHRNGGCALDHRVDRLEAVAVRKTEIEKDDVDAIVGNPFESVPEPFDVLDLGDLDRSILALCPTFTSVFDEQPLDELRVVGIILDEQKSRSSDESIRVSVHSPS